MNGDRLAGLQYTHLSAGLPVILVIGGSLGSVTVNQAVRSILPELLKNFQIIHICGKGNLDESLIGMEGYVQYEYCLLYTSNSPAVVAVSRSDKCNVAKLPFNFS